MMMTRLQGCNCCIRMICPLLLGTQEKLVSFIRALHNQWFWCISWSRQALISSGSYRLKTCTLGRNYQRKLKIQPENHRHPHRHHRSLGQVQVFFFCNLIFDHFTFVHLLLFFAQEQLLLITRCFNFFTVALFTLVCHALLKFTWHQIRKCRYFLMPLLSCCFHCGHDVGTCCSLSVVNRSSKSHSMHWHCWFCPNHKQQKIVECKTWNIKGQWAEAMMCWEGTKCFGSNDFFTFRQ